MKGKDKYQFIWRGYGICYFVADLILRGYYVEEGITLYEKPAGEGYISKKGLVEAGKIGLKLCRNRAKIKQVISDAKKIAPRARKVIEHLKKAELRKKSDKELFLEFIQAVKNFIYSLDGPLCVKDLKNPVINKKDYFKNLDLLIKYTELDAVSLLSPRHLNKDVLEKIFEYAWDGKDIDF